MYPLPPGTSPILGVEFSGTVEEPGSSDYKKGDDVCVPALPTRRALHRCERGC